MTALKWQEPVVGPHFAETESGAYEVGSLGSLGWGVTLPSGTWLPTRYKTAYEAKAAAQGVVDYIALTT